MIHLKSQREIDRMRKCADFVSRVLAEVAREVEPDVTTAHLNEVAERYFRKHDVEPAFKGYKMGSLDPFPTALCVSVNDVVVHGIPGDYRLREGDLVAVDCGVRLDGYFGDSAYTFAVGSISSEKARLCRVTREALYDGIAQAVHGGRIGDVSYAVQSRGEADGFGVVRDLVGHGIGRRLHEDPEVPNVGRRGTGRKLKSGATICIEPMINLGTYDVTTSADGWTVRTVDGSPSAHYEHMIAVCGDTPEILTTFEFIEDVTNVPQTTSQHTNG